MVKQLWATQLHSLAANAAMVKLLLLGAAVGALATSCEDGWYLANYVSRQRRSPPAGTRHCAFGVVSLLSARASLPVQNNHVVGKPPQYTTMNYGGSSYSNEEVVSCKETCEQLGGTAVGVPASGVQTPAHDTIRARSDGVELPATS